IVSEIGHEANVGPWWNLGREGFVVKMWEADPDTLTCPLQQLERLLTDRTKIVAFPHVSNLLGRIEDIQGAIELAHSAGARVVIDGVAYASHRAIDVEAWNADWYLYGPYKVYGPHLGVMYGSHEAFAEIRGPNHFFIPDEEIPYKFEPGGVIHEHGAGLLALGDYLKLLAGREDDEPCDRATIVKAYDVMTALEQPLQQRIISYLKSKPGITIIGPDHAEVTRVPTISFHHDKVKSVEIAKALCQANIGARNGHMYTARLCAKLGYDLEDGFARVSLLHYNTQQEIDRLIEVLDGIL
ncbi:MAG: aminotransferase class V-fold PLP-dependent enzyme, partial [Planctomycetota bacterium]|nr:aminotransferase class V-fold PLP-dependent enzyme [Planctomycetota bacterium]